MYRIFWKPCISLVLAIASVNGNATVVSEFGRNVVLQGENEVTAGVCFRYTISNLERLIKIAEIELLYSENGIFFEPLKKSQAEVYSDANCLTVLNLPENNVIENIVLSGISSYSFFIKIGPDLVGNSSRRYLRFQPNDFSPITAVQISNNLALDRVPKIIEKQLGDRDCFGTSNAPCVSVPVEYNCSGTFDPGTPITPASMTDRDLRCDSPRVVTGVTAPTAGYSFDLSSELSNGRAIKSGTLSFFIGGVQDGEGTNGLIKIGTSFVPNTINDLLFVNAPRDTHETPGAFNQLNQGPIGVGVVTFDLTATQINTINSEKLLNIFLKLGQVAGYYDSINVDYVTISVITVPPSLSIPIE